jgi:undecaprenyl diphosphate synthase
MPLQSIGFIPDGNRRYATSVGASFTQSYLQGTKKAWDVLNWLGKYSEINTVTFYTLSLRNLERPKSELMVLLKIFEQELGKVLKKKEVMSNGINIRFLGRRDGFSKSMQDKMAEIEQATNQFNNKFVQLCIGYDGQTEIIDAAQNFASDVLAGKDLNDINIDSFKKYLYADFKAPDLIVRTSKEQRLSGFLTYQSAYSELAFLDKYWPAITEKDIDLVISDFNKRHRRFGK